jgi:hypothetical protein
MSNSFISGQPSVQGEDGAQNSNEQQPQTDLQEYSWNMIKVSFISCFTIVFRLIQANPYLSHHQQGIVTRVLNSASI